MPVGPQRKQVPLSRQVARKVVLHPDSRASSQSGITTDKRPHAANGNLSRSLWMIPNRSDKGDWT
jgi:hypothetical protein